MHSHRVNSRGSFHLYLQLMFTAESCQHKRWLNTHLYYIASKYFPKRKHTIIYHTDIHFAFPSYTLRKFLTMLPFVTAKHVQRCGNFCGKILITARRRRRIQFLAVFPSSCLRNKHAQSIQRPKTNEQTTLRDSVFGYCFHLPASRCRSSFLC